MGTAHPDKLVVKRLLRGDSAAFDRFFADYFPRLYRFTLSRVGADEDAVKEIVQKTLCRAVQKLHTYRGEAALYTWLCRLCRNEISEHFKHTRKTAARECAFDDAGIGAILETLDSGERHEPSHAAQRLQLRELIQTILDHLPARQGNALEWMYVQGLSVREIAARLDVSESAAQSLLARARQRFREGFSAIARDELEALLR